MLRNIATVLYFATMLYRGLEAIAKRLGYQSPSAVKLAIQSRRLPAYKTKLKHGRYGWVTSDDLIFWLGTKDIADRLVPHGQVPIFRHMRRRPLRRNRNRHRARRVLPAAIPKSL
ncbi:MAG TPA: hypothetical protein VIH42_15050 [Thermoguttaceae bacterium]